MASSLAQALGRRTLLTTFGIAIALFALAALIGGIWGQNPDSDVLSAIGAFAWFGWMIALLVTVVLSVISLAAHALSSRAEA